MIDIRVHSQSKYELLNTIEYSYNQWKVIVLKGFVWDGASIPRNLWEEVGCPCSHLYASCIHDALYQSALLDRKTSDKIFHRCLLDNGVDSITAKAMYLGVRFAGEQYYGSDKSNARNFVKIDIIH